MEKWALKVDLFTCQYALRSKLKSRSTALLITTSCCTQLRTLSKVSASGLVVGDINCGGVALGYLAYPSSLEVADICSSTGRKGPHLKDNPRDSASSQIISDLVNPENATNSSHSSAGLQNCEQEPHRHRSAKKGRLPKASKKDQRVENSLRDHALIREELSKAGHTEKELRTLKWTSPYSVSFQGRPVTATFKGTWSKEETERLLEMLENDMHPGSLLINWDEVFNQSTPKLLVMRKISRDAMKYLSTQAHRLFRRKLRIPFSCHALRKFGKS